MTISALSRKHNVSRKAIQVHIRKDMWIQDVSSDLQRAVEAKVAGVVAGCDLRRKAGAIEAEAQRRADVEFRQRKDWEPLQKKLNLCVSGLPEKPEEEDSKLKTIKAMIATIKAAAEAMMTIHGGERKSWRLDTALPTPPGAKTILSPELAEIVDKITNV
ncbi:MAG: hypothetical protein HQK55_07985 [Deltaproteobacteria bacterium]|nr:hypothetical protein [Deltaproteobacteria bacterium]